MFKKIMLPTVLAVALIVPVAACAAASSETQTVSSQTTNQAQVQQQKHNPAKDHGRRGHHFGKRGFKHGILGGGVHQQMYLTLLAEKYAPESLASWEPVFVEKNRLQEEFKALFKSTPYGLRKFLKTKTKDEMIVQREKQTVIYKSFDEAVKSKDAAKIKRALGELLESFKKQNKHMAEKLHELKKQAAE